MFLITSFIHMFLAYYIMRNCLNIAKDFHDTSLKWKWRSMMLNVFSTLIACYFFYRHNKYCEPFGKAILIDINSYYLMWKVTLYINFSIFYVCFERIWSCDLKYGISSNCSIGFCHDTFYNIRKQAQNYLKSFDSQFIIIVLLYIYIWIFYCILLYIFLKLSLHIILNFHIRKLFLSIIYIRGNILTSSFLVWLHCKY